MKKNLGLEVANYYQEAGYKQLNRIDKSDRDELVVRYKAEGRDKEIQKALKELKNQVLTDIPFPLAYVAGSLFEDK